MAVDIVMPQMGESIFEGTITKWLKKPGDKVERDEPLFEISTDKVDAEIPSPSAGVLREIKVGEGKTVPIQTVVGVIDAAGDGAAAAKAAPAPIPASKVAEPARPAAPAPAAKPQIVPPAQAISPPFPVPVRAAASASKTSKPTSPVALNRQPKLPSPPQRPMLPLHRRRNAPPLRPHRRLLPPAARCTWLLSPPCPAKKCTSVITKCSP